MLIHLPIIILTSLHPTPIADAMRNSMLRGSASSKAARRRNRAGARPKRRKRATNFERNGHNSLPACNQETSAGGFFSYVELQTCLGMEREVNQERDAKNTLK
jgi:hypothetical protein